MTENYLVPNVNSADAEKPWSNLSWIQGSKPGRAVSEWVSKFGLRDVSQTRAPKQPPTAASPSVLHEGSQPEVFVS